MKRLVLVPLAAFAFAACQLRLSQSAEPISTTYTQLTFSGIARNPVASPDGNFLAYWEYVGPGDRLMVQDLSGGRPLEILRDTVGLGPPRWSPDGTKLLVNVRGRRGLYTVPRLGGGLQAVHTFSPVPGRSQWYISYDYSPDGREVFLVESYLEAERQHSLLTTIGDAPADTVILQTTRSILHVEWSPSGDWLALETRDPLMWRIEIWSRNGEVVDSLVATRSTGNRLLAAHWNRDGTALYYVEARGEGDNPQLRKVPIDTETGRITGSPSTVALAGMHSTTAFDVSPDGSNLYYTRQSIRSHVWLIDLDPDGRRNTSARTQLTEGTAAHIGPSVARDGSMIAFYRIAGPNRSMYVMPFEGGPPRLVAADGWRPTPSPDGSRLAFVAGDRRAMVVDVAGGDPQSVSSGSIYAEGSAFPILVWSPDGERLLYKATRRNFTLVDLATGREGPLLLNEAGSVDSPVFSPDGARVAVDWRAGNGQRGIWVIDLADGSTTFLTQGEHPLLWSDDNTVYFLRGGDWNEIWSIDPTGGQANLYAEWPGLCRTKSMPNDARYLVCDEPYHELDIWVAEHFDPGVR